MAPVSSRFRSAPSAATVAIARGLAASHQAANLPCPACGASLAARNLETHLAMLHDATEWTAAAASSDAEWTGGDRRILRWLVGLTVAAMFGAMTAVAVTPFDPQNPSIVVWSAILGLAVCIGSTMLAWFDKFRARLMFRGDALELRYGLRLLRHSVRLPARVETGRAYEVRESSSYGRGMGGEMTVGTYLRLTAGSASLTIRCPQDCALEEHWDSRGLSPGQKSRRWDITLDRTSFAGVEYALAERGTLSLLPG